MTELITSEEMARKLGITPKTLHQWRYKKRGPDYVKVGKSVFYTIASFDRYVVKNTVKLES